MNTTTKLHSRLAVTPAEALLILSLSRDLAAAQKTARNQISNRTFPLPLKRIGGHWVVAVAEIYKALSNTTETEPAPLGVDMPTPPAPVRLGRSTRAEQKRAEALGISISVLRVRDAQGGEQ